MLCQTVDEVTLPAKVNSHYRKVQGAEKRKPIEHLKIKFCGNFILLRPETL